MNIPYGLCGKVYLIHISRRRKRAVVMHFLFLDMLLTASPRFSFLHSPCTLCNLHSLCSRLFHIKIIPQPERPQTIHESLSSSGELLPRLEGFGAVEG
jgi:hypothetical protein